jgi:hypothetical protein
MNSCGSTNLAALSIHKRSLIEPIDRRRSRAWLNRLWSRFIKVRDGYRCSCCDTTENIQAHHILRKTRCTWAALDLGNGITLCVACHRKVHDQFNGRPDLLLPLGLEQGDDQDEWGFLFGVLRDDAVRRGLHEDEFYCLSDGVLEFSNAYQGYEEFREAMTREEISRIRFTHEIWRLMPIHFYSNLASELAEHFLLGKAR